MLSVFMLNVIMLNVKAPFAALHSDHNSPKSGLFHLTGQPKPLNGREKVREGTVSAAPRHSA